jgi:inosine-uridine nucleoside N-ribohydrolase
MKRSIILVLAVLVLVAACGADAPSARQDTAVPATAAPASARPSRAAGGGPRPIVIDTDLAADDILAIMVLLRDPTVDVRAVTVVGTGEVRCPAGLRNIRRLLAAFGRTDTPAACGRENPGPNGRWFPVEWRDGADAFYGLELPAVDDEGARGKPAAELLVDLAAEAAAAGAPLTIVPLGPWTNLADAAVLDPAFAGNLAGIHAMGGAIDVPGNISADDTTPADGVEWNLGADPDAVSAVLDLDVPITFVPLDATNDVPVPADIADQLASDHGAAGADIAYEMYVRSPYLSTEGNDYWDALTAVLLRDPTIARWEDVAVRAERSGSSAGRLVRGAGGRTVRVAMTADRDAFIPAFLAALRAGPQRSKPFTIASTLSVAWDGTTCRQTADSPTASGPALVKLENTSTSDAGLLVAGVVAPKRWPDVVAFAKAADFSDPNLAIPDWIVPVPGNIFAAPGTTATALAALPAAEVGILCAVGQWPKFDITDGGAFMIGG